MLANCQTNSHCYKTVNSTEQLSVENFVFQLLVFTLVKPFRTVKEQRNKKTNCFFNLKTNAHTLFLVKTNIFYNSVSSIENTKQLVQSLQPVVYEVSQKTYRFKVVLNPFLTVGGCFCQRHLAPVLYAL